MAKKKLSANAKRSSATGAKARQALSERARTLAGKTPAYFHGTRYSNSILATGRLLCFPSPRCDHAVCFSPDPCVAAHWATVDRSEDDGFGAIFIFDRRLIRLRYKIVKVDTTWEKDGREREERVQSRDVLLSDGLIGFVSQPNTLRNRRAETNPSWLESPNRPPSPLYPQRENRGWWGGKLRRAE